MKLQFQFIEHAVCFSIYPHKDLGRTGIGFAMLSLAAGLKWSALTKWPLREISIRNNEKYINIRSKFVTNGKKIMYDA